MKFYGIFPVLPGCGSGCRFLFWMMIHDKLYPKIRRFSRIEHRLCANFWFWQTSRYHIMRLVRLRPRCFFLAARSSLARFMAIGLNKPVANSLQVYVLPCHCAPVQTSAAIRFPSHRPIFGDTDCCVASPLAMTAGNRTLS